MQEASTTTSARHDFDFFFGDWRVHHHRLDRRLAQCNSWSDFEGRSSARPLLGRLGNIDENVLESPSGRYEAVTIRLLDEPKGRWSIYWIDGRDPKMDTPMQGGFADGLGTFFGDDTFEGTPIRVRFLWSGITATSVNWEQAFSTDGGTSWETNWSMRFERLS